eukprot:765307-Hanusia_phi.AAC.4
MVKFEIAAWVPHQPPWQHPSASSCCDRCLTGDSNFSHSSSEACQASAHQSRTSRSTEGDPPPFLHVPSDRLTSR